MLLLVGANDLLRVVTAQAGTLDVYADFLDMTQADPPVVKGSTSGRSNTKITTATTTTVVGNPGAGATRNVKELHICNNHASTSMTLALEHTDGSNVIPLESLTLLAGERLSYIEGVGFVVFDANGLPKSAAVGRATGSAITAQIAAFSADTYIGANLNVGGRLVAGCYFRWHLVVSKGAGGTATPTFIIRTGTAGAIGDAARLTMTGPAQSAAADTARIKVEGTFRAVGAAAVIRGDVEIAHNLAATGFATTGPAGSAHFGGTSGTFDSSPANTILGLSVNPGASGAWVVEQAMLDVAGLLP